MELSQASPGSNYESLAGKWPLAYRVLHQCQGFSFQGLQAPDPISQQG
jgi:hypothetical protein